MPSRGDEVIVEGQRHKGVIQKVVGRNLAVQLTDGRTIYRDKLFVKRFGPKS